MPLTTKQIDNAKPAAKPRRLSDEKGLYLEVSPRGGKLWRMKYRYAGKEKRLALGTYPAKTLAKAREDRDQARTLLENGVDPALLMSKRARKLAQAEAAGNSFEATAREWFEKHSPNWADSHGSRVIRRLERDIFPWIGRRPIDDVTPREVLEALRRIEARGSLETAHRALQNCGQVFRYAVATARATSDPCRDLRGALPPVKDGHFAAATDPEQLGGILRTIEGHKGTAVVHAAMRLAPYVFVRPGELRKARWEDVDLDAAEWRFLVTKTQTPHIVPLADQAVEILRDLQPLTGHGEYVFPSARSPRGDRPMSENAILYAMRDLGIERDQMTVHGWRAAARTLLDEALGFPPHLIEHQLAHQVRDALGRAYNRTSHLDGRREMMQAWADYLDGLRAGDDHKVIALKTATRGTDKADGRVA